MNLISPPLQAIKDFVSLKLELTKHTIDKYDHTAKSMCEVLKGHNLNEELFDVNYGTICATIRYEELDSGIYFRLLEDDIEVWSEGVLINIIDITEEDLLEYANFVHNLNYRFDELVSVLSSRNVNAKIQIEYEKHITQYDITKEFIKCQTIQKSEL